MADIGSISSVELANVGSVAGVNIANIGSINGTNTGQTPVTSYTAKSIILEYSDNWGDGTYSQFRQMDLYYQESKLSLTLTDYTAYGAYYAATLETRNIWNTLASYIGAPNNAGWVSTAGGNVTRRLTCVFNTPQTFDKIVVNNGHNAGTGQLTRGLKNIVVTISDDAITDTTYQAAITNATIIFTGQINMHIASNVQDDQTILDLVPL